VVDSPVDNLLAEFGSVVDTVKCDVKIQEALKAKNAELPDNRKIKSPVLTGSTGDFNRNSRIVPSIGWTSERRCL
jgi:hypothetical protein